MTATQVDVSPDEGVELLHLSNEYDIPRLQEKCESIVTKGVDFENVAYVYQLSKLYRTPKLYEFCQSIIIKHFDVVSATETYESLSPEDKKHLGALATGQNRQT